MRKLELEIFKFSELTEEAQKEAIQSVRKRYEDTDRGYDFPLWAIDDCSLFEPKDTEMKEIFKDEYLSNIGDPFMIKNNRDGIRFDLDSGIIYSAETMEITNRNMFMRWAGLSKSLSEKVSDIELLDDQGRTTEVEFYFDIEDLSKLTKEENSNLESARAKFRDHMFYVLRKIQSDVDYRWSDEGIEDDIENGSDEFEFTKTGNIFDLEIYED